MSVAKKINRFVLITHYLPIVLALLFVATAQAASTHVVDHAPSTASNIDKVLQQYSPSAMPIEQQIVLIKRLYEKKLIGIQTLNSVFPVAWLQEDSDLSADKAELEAYLATLLAAPNQTQVADTQKQLLELKLRWLTFLPAERLALIGEASAKQQIKNNEKIAERAIAQADATTETLEQSKKNVDAALALADNEREKFLLSLLLTLEKNFAWLAQQTKIVAQAQVQWGEKTLAWREASSNIKNALEDEGFVPGTQDFALFRQQLRDRLSESNSVIYSKNNFINYYFANGFEESLPALPPSVQVRASDDQNLRDLVNQIQQKRTELQSASETFKRTRAGLMQQLISTQLSYRQALLQLRGQLIAQVITNSAFALNKSEPVMVEFNTIVASVRYFLWKHDAIGEPLTGVNSSLTFKLFRHLFKLIALAAFIVWLFIKRQAIIRKSQLWLIGQMHSRKHIQWVKSGFALISQLYVFIILLMLGQLLIAFLVGVGVSSASFLAPILRHVVVFFLILGLVNYLSPLLSQRGAKAKRDLEEVSAMEAVFEFIPKLYLYYWLVSGLVSIVLWQYLQENLLRFYLLNVISIVFIFTLFVIIWLKRHRWRLINEKATRSVLWQKIGGNARGKLWEPLILLIGGGIGVYRVAWAILAERLTEMEMTRSFQAMVSRAILERQYKRSATKIIASRFPEKYWNAFNYLTPAEPKWYVPRSEGEALLDTLYTDWRDKNRRARVLICGDRGIGKTELIANFLRVNNVTALHSHLMTGDTHLKAICQRFAQDFLGDASISDGEQLTQALLQLPPRVICIENIENALLRKVGGFDGFAFVIDLLLRASEHHLCIVTCTSYAWTIAKQGLVGANCFSETVMLGGMSEEHLKNMLLGRHNDSHASPPDFSSLNFGESAKARKLKKHDVDAVEKSTDLYFRILWDYTRGNPRQALYCWKSSLAWVEAKTVVNLFEVPEQKVLENLQDTTLMLLAALIEHNGLTVEDLAKVMNIAVVNVRRRIEELAPYDIVFCISHGEKAGWHVESFWTRAVENYLEKRQFLFRGNKL